MTPPVLVLTHADVAALLPVDACLAAVAEAFRLHAEGRSLAPQTLAIDAGEGAFHVKVAGLPLRRLYFAAKLNANFPANLARAGLPTIQGIVALCDASNGVLLALMDSTEITTRRTAAATAIAARYLAREDARVATLCGCGAQALAQLEAIRTVRALDRILAFDVDLPKARRFAETAANVLGLDVEAAPSLDAAVAASAIVVTCTTSRRAFLGPDLVRPGTFVAAVGADHPEKQEIEPALMARATVVVDLVQQAVAFGDLHHAVEAGALGRDDVYAELADLIVGRRPGRTSDDEITLFDSTGTALQDVAAAVVVYEGACKIRRGTTVSLAGASS